MALASGQDERRHRLQQIAADWGVSGLPPLEPLRIPVPRSLAPNPNDEYLAEEILQRRRVSAAADKNFNGGVRRAFTTNKKKGWDPQEVFEALDAHVGSAGSPGVAEALVAKLKAAGGDLNVAAMKSRTNLLTRRKSLELLERSRILQKAIENRQTDMVAVLVQHADSLTLDSALPKALRCGDFAIAAMLIQRGANAAQTAGGQDAFRQLCMSGGQADLVELILRSDGRPSAGWVSQSMVDAARKGCLDTVLRLSRSTADGSYNNAHALKEAVTQCRVDVCLALLTGARPPAGQGLDEAFEMLCANKAIMPNEKLTLTQALLCAGATGDVVSAALVEACDMEFYEMVDLLVSYGASIEFQDALALRKAVSKGKSSIIQLLLTERTPLSRTHATECVELLPKKVANEDRHAILKALLQKGAHAPAINDALVDAVEAADLESVKLLTTPHIAEGQVVTADHDLRTGPRGMVYDRHETASVDHRGGLALQIAVLAGNVVMVKQLLAAKPSPETLAEVFPQIRNLSPAERFHTTECFLAAGLTGPCVATALQEAVAEEPPKRDESLIGLLIHFKADVNFNDGIALRSAVSRRDLRLLAALVNNGPTPRSAANAMLKALGVEDFALRYQMIRVLIDVGAGSDTKSVTEAVIQILQAKPIDIQLLNLLLDTGMADINVGHGIPVIHGKCHFCLYLYQAMPMLILII
jgi:ankyrin repeat protein